MRRIDGRLEEAALLVAPRRRVLRRITLPLAAPGVFAAALMIFVLVGLRIRRPRIAPGPRVHDGSVHGVRGPLRLQPRRCADACRFCCCASSLRLSPPPSSATGSSRRAGVPVPVPFYSIQWRRSATVAAIAILFVALVLPLAILLGEALGARSLVEVLADSRGAIVNSLLLATIGATAVVTVAVWLGYARARSGGRLGQGADILFVVLFAVPSTIVGVGLIGLWNRSGPFGAVYGTDAMLVLGYLARFIPVTALALAASTRYVPCLTRRGRRGQRRRMAAHHVAHRPAADAARVWLLRGSSRSFWCSASLASASSSHRRAKPLCRFASIRSSPTRPPHTSRRWRSFRPPSSSCRSPHSERPCRCGRPGEHRRSSSIANVTKRFGAHQALDGVSLEVAAGEGVVIVGPSGCGKTTLLRLVAGLDVPDGGEIWMAGTQVSAQHRSIVPPHERGIGFVFQDLALWPHLTVQGNLDFVLESARHAASLPQSESP